MSREPMTAMATARAVAAGELTAVEAVTWSLERIESTDADIRAFITVTADRALERARRIDARRQAGEHVGPLAGVPVALKDNICTRGVRTTCASRILENFVSPYDATVVEKLVAAGAVIVGKTNMDEFAMGSSTDNSGFFTTRNPWDLTRVPGGSSGGSAAAVAAGQVPLALGSDTGGSIRQPAALTGVVGLKPTYGAVSRYGLVAFASSLDQIGPFARTVEEAALLLDLVAGRDARDATSVGIKGPSLREELDAGVKGLRIGVPREYLAEGTEPAVRDAVMAAVQKLVDLGARAEECSLPHTDYGLSAYYLIAPAEASSNLARYDGIRYGLRVAAGGDVTSLYEATRAAGFGPEVKRRIMLGTYALSAGYYDAYYRKAQQVRTLIKRDFDEAFERFDIIASPTSPITAFPVGARAGDPLQMYLADVCTLPVNLAGLPGISIPCGFTDPTETAPRGLPIGLQLIGKPFDERTLLRAAYAYEQAAGHHLVRPEWRGRR